MKLLILILLNQIYFINSKNLNEFKFRRYDKCSLDTFILLRINSNNPTSSFSVKIEFKNKKWQVVKKIYSNINFKIDSTINFRCDDCNQKFEEILHLGLRNIPDEGDLNYPCRIYKDTLIDNNTIREVHDLEGVSDIAIYTIEYKIGKKYKFLKYRDPNIAIKYCPDSEERIKFLRIVEILKGL